MAAPTVTSVTPPTGIVGGGTICILIGTNFTGATAVTFGGTAAASFEVVSATRLYAVAPAHATGLVDVAVTNPSGTGTGTSLFTFEAENTDYNLYLFGDSCHVWISTNSGGTFVEGCTPGNSSTPAPNDPGLDPHGFGTISDTWSDAQMAINDADYATILQVDETYNEFYGIVATSSTGLNQSWTLIDPEPHDPAFVSGPDYSQDYLRAAISANAETILLPVFTDFSSPAEDYYPRISYDSGATWANVTGVEPNVAWVAACFGSTTSQIMYLQPYSGFGTGSISPAYIRKSTDWGVTWSALTNGPDAEIYGQPSTLRLRCSADGQTIIRVDRGGHFWISQDGGANWTDTNLLSTYSISSGTHADCAIAPDGQTIIVCYEQTITSPQFPFVIISTDGGSSFTDITANLQYPATAGPPTGGQPATVSTGATQCAVSPDGLGMVVLFDYKDTGKVEPDGLTGFVMYANVSTDGGATFKLVSFDADPYEFDSITGLMIGAYITPATPTPPPEPPPMPPTPPSGDTTTRKYFIERMDNRIWATIEDAWCLDSALTYPQPEPAATVTASSGSGSQNIVLYTVANGGAGYTSPIGQVIDIEGGGTGATVTLSVSSGIITNATAVTIGSGYLHPTLSILDTTGVGAVVQPIVTNYVTMSATASVFTSASVGDIIRMGGGKLEVVWTGLTSGSTSSAIANVISPITAVTPDDPNETVLSASAGNWTMATPTTSVSGLWHLEGMTVYALADGGVVRDLTVEDGAVTLPYSASQILVGLPFTAQAQTMYLDAGGGQTIQTRRKSGVQAVLRVENSRAPEIGMNQPDAAAQPNFAEIPWYSGPPNGMTDIKYRTPTMPAGQAAPMFSGDLDISNLFGTFDQRGQVAIQQKDPLPLSISAVVLWVSVADTPGQ